MMGFSREQLEIVVQKAQEKILANREKANSLIKDYTYIDWLEKFTLINKEFANDTWLYSKDSIAKADYDCVMNLEYFEMAIANYCQSFNIEFGVKDKFEFGRYHIKHNGVGYRISLFCGQGSYVWVQREEIFPGAINFETIVRNVAPF